MHDTDAFTRMPVLDPAAAQPPLSELLLVFEKVVDVIFKDERYRP